MEVRRRWRARCLSKGRGCAARTRRPDRGGCDAERWILLPAGFFGLAGVGEIHHVVKTFAHGAYFPGAVSAVAFATVGALLFRAVIRELRRDGPVHAHARPVEA